MEIKVKDETVTFEVKTGTVLEHNSTYETKVHSTGGGGYIHEGRGYVEAPNIASSSTRHESIWVKLQDGEEKCITFDDTPLQVRAGQTIKLLIVRVSSSGFQYVAGVKNLQTNEFAAINAKEILTQTQLFKYVTGNTFWLYTGLGVILGGGISAILGMDITDGAGLVMFLFGAAGFGVSWNKSHQVDSEFKKYTESIENYLKDL